MVRLLSTAHFFHFLRAASKAALRKWYFLGCFRQRCPWEVDGRDPGGRTPLAISACRGDLQACRLLLEASADAEVLLLHRVRIIPLSELGLRGRAKKVEEMGCAK